MSYVTPEYLHRWKPDFLLTFLIVNPKPTPMFTEIVQILKRNSNYEIIKTSHKGKKSIFIKQQNPSRASVIMYFHGTRIML